MLRVVQHLRNRAGAADVVDELLTRPGSAFSSSVPCDPDGRLRVPSLWRIAEEEKDADGELTAAREQSASLEQPNRVRMRGGFCVALEKLLIELLECGVTYDSGFEVRLSLVVQQFLTLVERELPVLVTDADKRPCRGDFGERARWSPPR